MNKSVITIFAFLFAISIAQASETVNGAKKDLESFKKEMSVKLEQVEQQIDELKIKAKSKGSETQEKTVKELEETRDKLQTQINELETDTKSGWRKMKSKLSTSIDKLHSKVQKALED